MSLAEFRANKDEFFRDAPDSPLTAHQKRMWFVQKNTTRGWYLPPDQIYGTAKYFDFGPLMTMGGTQVISDVIRLCGGENVFGALKPMAVASTSIALSMMTFAGTCLPRSNTV